MPLDLHRALCRWGSPEVRVLLTIAEHFFHSRNLGPEKAPRRLVPISYHEFSACTGLSDSTINGALDRLQSQRMIEVHRTARRTPSEYGIRDCDLWGGVDRRSRAQARDAAGRWKSGRGAFSKSKLSILV
jgi:hypothetical protein